MRHQNGDMRHNLDGVKTCHGYIGKYPTFLKPRTFPFVGRRRVAHSRSRVNEDNTSSNSALLYQISALRGRFCHHNVAPK
jgi:hypothetical protein